MRKKLLAGALAFLVLLAVPASAAELEDVLAQLGASDGPQQAERLMHQLEAEIALRRSQDPAYDQRLQAAEARAARVFAEKRMLDQAAADRNTPTVSAQSVPWHLLLPGDIMHINNKKFFNIYAMYYSHSGIYNGNNTVYESNSDGVRVLPLSSWQQGQPVALGYTRNRSHSQVVAALNWAKATYGTDGRTPYNWNFLNKTTDSALYCSQLVWKMHQYMGIDVDSNHWAYALYLTAKFGAVGTTFALAAVAPDEIYLSDEIVYYYAD